MEALDSATMKWFVQAFESGGKFSLNLIAKSAAAILRGIARSPAAGFSRRWPSSSASSTISSAASRSARGRVESALRGDEVAFVLVTSASPPSIQEVLYFAERLTEAHMPRGAFVVNRFHLPPAHADKGVSVADAAGILAARGLTLEDDAAERFVQAHADAVKLAALDARHLRALDVSGGVDADRARRGAG